MLYKLDTLDVATSTISADYGSLEAQQAQSLLRMNQMTLTPSICV